MPMVRVPCPKCTAANGIMFNESGTRFVARCDACNSMQTFLRENAVDEKKSGGSAKAEPMKPVTTTKAGGASGK